MQLRPPDNSLTFLIVGQRAAQQYVATRALYFASPASIRYIRAASGRYHQLLN